MASFLVYKVLVGFLVVLAAGSATGAAYYYEKNQSLLPPSASGTLSQQLANLQGQVDTYKNQIASLKSQISSLQSLNESQTVTIAELRRGTGTDSAKLSRLEAVNVSQTAQISDLYAQLAGQKAISTDLQTRLSNLQNDLTALQGTITRLTSTNADLLARNTSLTSQVATLNSQVTKLNADIALLKDQNSHPYLTIWTFSQAIAANNFLEHGVPDTFDYYVSYTADTKVGVYLLSFNQFAEFYNCASNSNAVKRLTCVTGTYQYFSPTTSLVNGLFTLAEGCGAYVAIYYQETGQVVTLHPDVSIKYNPATSLTGVCA